MAACRLKISKPGLKAFRKIGAYVKPTTRMIQVFGHLATRGKVTVTKQEILKLARKQNIQVHEPMENGYVILVLETSVVGMGFVKDGLLRGELRRDTICWV